MKIHKDLSTVNSPTEFVEFAFTRLQKPIDPDILFEQGEFAGFSKSQVSYAVWGLVSAGKLDFTNDWRIIENK
jgi:hypothetical protein